MVKAQFNYGEAMLTVGLALDIARGKIKGILSDEVREKVKQNRKVVMKIAKGENEVKEELQHPDKE